MPIIPEWLGGANGLLGGTAVLILLIAFFWKPVRALWKRGKVLAQFLEDWNGTPERRDHAGGIIEKAKPGVPALLETVRSQVQNSHSTNLRDDFDAMKESVDRVTAKLDEHIEIAIKSDAAQDRTAEQVMKLVEDVGKLKTKYAPE